MHARHAFRPASKSSSATAAAPSWSPLCHAVRRCAVTSHVFDHRPVAVIQRCHTIAMKRSHVPLAFISLTRCATVKNTLSKTYLAADRASHAVNRAMLFSTAASTAVKAFATLPVENAPHVLRLAGSHDDFVSIPVRRSVTRRPHVPKWSHAKQSLPFNALAAISNPAPSAAYRFMRQTRRSRSSATIPA